MTILVSIPSCKVITKNHLFMTCCRFGEVALLNGARLDKLGVNGLFLIVSVKVLAKSEGS